MMLQTVLDAGFEQFLALLRIRDILVTDPDPRICTSD
jgi:hypothetical protein